MIETVIARLSGHSAAVKNFCLTLYGGVMALSVAQNQPKLLSIAVSAPMLFGLLDAYYLGVERSFRDFYRSVANRPLLEAEKLTMDQETPTSSPQAFPERSQSTASRSRSASTGSNTTLSGHWKS